MNAVGFFVIAFLQFVQAGWCWLKLNQPYLAMITVTYGIGNVIFGTMCVKGIG